MFLLAFTSWSREVIVTSTADNGSGTLREAVDNALPNDTIIIDGIEGYKENIVYFYNPWGDVVDRIENYDNTQNV